MASGHIELRLSSKSSVSKELDRFKDQLRERVRQGLQEIAQHLLVDSRPYVPVLTGDLLRSGRVSVQSFSLDGNEYATVLYGSDVVRYAWRQHEEEFNHPSLGFRGAAKYLQRPFELNQRFYFELFRLNLGRFFREFRGSVNQP